MSYQHVLAIAKQQPISFLGSITEDGFPKIRAMLSPCKWEENRLYYHTNTSSGKIAEFRRNPRACVYFCDASGFRGATLLGEIEVVEDTAIKQDLWKDGYTLYYSGGVTDPDYCVLCFTAHRGELYGDFQVQRFSVE